MTEDFFDYHLRTKLAEVPFQAPVRLRWASRRAHVLQTGTATKRGLHGLWRGLHKSQITCLMKSKRNWGRICCCSCCLFVLFTGRCTVFSNWGLLQARRALLMQAINALALHLSWPGFKSVILLQVRGVYWPFFSPKLVPFHLVKPLHNLAWVLYSGVKRPRFAAGNRQVLAEKGHGGLGPGVAVLDWWHLSFQTPVWNQGDPSRLHNAALVSMPRLIRSYWVSFFIALILTKEGWGNLKESVILVLRGTIYICFEICWQ